jgi:transcriptional regulator with GAF, ATPase, and Fis domain
MDLTAHKELQATLLRLDRSLQMLRQCNLALVHANDEQELLVSICRILVESGGLRMAWVGYRRDDPEKTVHPVAHAGFEAGYVQEVRATWGDSERGQGPTGTAIRTGGPSWIRNIVLDQKFAPWQKSALRRGYASGLALPLASAGEVFGMLGLYSAEAGAFNEDTFSRYVEFANNLAYGITALRTRQKRAQAEEALRRSEAYDQIKTLKDRLYEESLALGEELNQASMFEEIVGNSSALREVLSRVAKVAPSDSTVLIAGETGTGKELIARAIHKRSSRSSRMFVSVNCAAIPSSLIASELFGHEKGAFTGALQKRIGRFELAEGGTIFLDEIGELPAETQVALLRVLQEREFERIGGNRPIPANVRVITATNRDLNVAVSNGQFRADLFYRLNVFPIELPPLRERKDDIRLLLAYFLERYAEKLGKRVRNIDRKTLERFASYTWPGNIRELQNVVERSLILCENGVFSVDEKWLPENVSSAGPEQEATPLTEKLLYHEKEMIEKALVSSKGRVAGTKGAAAKLGLPPSTLEWRIRALRINKGRFRQV